MLVAVAFSHLPYSFRFCTLINYGWALTSAFLHFVVSNPEILEIDHVLLRKDGVWGVIDVFITLQ